MLMPPLKTGRLKRTSLSHQINGFRDRSAFSPLLAHHQPKKEYREGEANGSSVQHLNITPWMLWMQ